MSRNTIVKTNPNSSTFVGGVGVAIATMFGPFNIANYKDLAVTVQVSGSHGIGFGVYTAPIQDDLYYLSATGNLVTITSGVKTPVTLNLINNNMSWLKIMGTSTAVNSASLINIVITSIERDM